MNFPFQRLKPRQSYLIEVHFRQIIPEATCVCIDQGDEQRVLVFSHDLTVCGGCPRVQLPTYISSEMLKDNILAAPLVYETEGAYNLSVVVYSSLSKTIFRKLMGVIILGKNPDCVAPTSAEFEEDKMANSSTPFTVQTTTKYTIRATVHGQVCVYNHSLYSWVIRNDETGLPIATTVPSGSGRVLELRNSKLPPGDYKVELVFTEKTKFGDIAQTVLSGYLRLTAVPLVTVFSSHFAGMYRVAVNERPNGNFCLSPGQNTFNPNTYKPLVSYLHCSYPTHLLR